MIATCPSSNFTNRYGTATERPVVPSLASSPTLLRRAAASLLINPLCHVNNRRVTQTNKNPIRTSPRGSNVSTHRHCRPASLFLALSAASLAVAFCSGGGGGPHARGAHAAAVVINSHIASAVGENDVDLSGSTIFSSTNDASYTFDVNAASNSLGPNSPPTHFTFAGGFVGGDDASYTAAGASPGTSFGAALIIRGCDPANLNLMPRDSLTPAAFLPSGGPCTGARPTVVSIRALTLRHRSSASPPTSKQFASSSGCDSRLWRASLRLRSQHRRPHRRRISHRSGFGLRSSLQRRDSNRPRQ